MMTKNNDPKPTAGRMKDKGVTAISDYLKPNMPLPQYLPYARFLLDTDLCHTAKMLYTLLLDRATLSQKNNWVDEQGRIYVIYPLSNLAKDLGCCVSSVTRAFTEWQTMRAENLGLFLWGGVGTGKSFLAGCIANALMEQEVPVRMTNFARILNELNSSFSGRNDVVDNLCRYPLLIIDDFGMERGTEYALEQIYNIVDSRYRSRKPLIVTTNLTLDEIRHPQDTAHARIYDRLLEMCIPISCIGVSFRKENAQEKLERMKLLIG